jgi:hypothetical protein
MTYTSPGLAAFQNADLDVDFPQAADEAFAMCGMIEDDGEFDCAVYEDAESIIPRSEWADRIKAIDDGKGWLERLVCKIKNQGREGTCVYNATALATEVAWCKQLGIENWIELSPISGYRNVARGPSSGSSVPGALIWMTDHGLIPVDSDANKTKVAAGMFKHVHPATGYWTKPAAGWVETAKLFRVDEFLKLTSVEAWVSALLNGFPCVGGRSMHCICHLRPLIDGNKIYSLYANSWGNWGKTFKISTGDQMGFGVDSESAIRTMTSRGAWCIRTVCVPPWLEA